MARLATVHAISGGTRVERVAEDIRNGIRLGQLIPGQVLRLRHIAEASKVRVSSLSILLETLEREGQLHLYNDVARVAPIDLAELRGAYRLLEQIEGDLAVRSCTAITAAEISALRSRIPAGQHVHDQPLDPVFQENLIFFTRLCAPAAARVDLLIYTDLRRSTQRYVELACRVLTGGATWSPARAMLSQSRIARCEEILVRYRAGDAAGARLAVRDYRRWTRRLAELSMEAATAELPMITPWPA